MVERAPGIHEHAEIRRVVRYLKSKKNMRRRGGRHNWKGKMNLSIETKVAIAVAAGFLMAVVGAMAQG